jgi:hypothetical protein
LEVGRFDLNGWESVIMSEPASISVASETIYLELTFRGALCIWWAYFWRHMLYGGVAVVIVGFLEGLAGLGGKHLLLSMSSVAVLIPVQIGVLGVVLHKQFRHFSIRLVASPRQSITT